MFPLNPTLLPGSVLPLKLYESRYLQLYRDIVDRDREFGVVLIERGMDSGGNDARFRTGSVARMVGSAFSRSTCSACSKHRAPIYEPGLSRA